MSRDNTAVGGFYMNLTGGSFERLLGGYIVSLLPLSALGQHAFAVPSDCVTMVLCYGLQNRKLSD
jgi:hypothetical protein